MKKSETSKPLKIIQHFENAVKNEEEQMAKERQKAMFSRRMAKFQPEDDIRHLDGVGTSKSFSTFWHRKQGKTIKNSALNVKTK